MRPKTLTGLKGEREYQSGWACGGLHKGPVLKGNNNAAAAAAELAQRQAEAAPSHGVGGSSALVAQHTH